MNNEKCMSEKPIKGVDFIGVTIAFLCHDGEGNYIMHRRSENCRDEHGRWDFGGGGLKFDEKIEEGLYREVNEEYGVTPVSHTYLGHKELFREHNGKKTHWIGFYFSAQVERDKVINNEPHKHDELRWVTLDNLPEPLHSQLPDTLETFKDKLT